MDFRVVCEYGFTDWFRIAQGLELRYYQVYPAPRCLFGWRSTARPACHRPAAGIVFWSRVQTAQCNEMETRGLDFNGFLRSGFCVIFDHLELPDLELRSDLELGVSAVVLGFSP